MDPVERILESCNAVVAAARDVRIDDGALEALAARLASETSVKPPAWDEGGWHYAADAAAGGPLTAQYVLVLDALNFCFWPSATALEYDVLASVLRDVLTADPKAFDAGALAAVTADTLRRWFAGHDLPNAEERARKLNEVGRVLAADFGGLAVNMIAAARGSAVALVELVTRHMPGFRDEAVYAPAAAPSSSEAAAAAVPAGAGRQAFQVTFYKRAQIFVADVWAAYGLRTAPGDGPAAFADISRLTCFADYRIPQLLHSGGVFAYSAPLHAAVLGKTQIAAGHPWEVEIRAATVVGVERLRARINELRVAAAAAAGAGGPAPEPLASVQVDWLLWQEGERRKEEIHPHHRTLTVFY